MIVRGTTPTIRYTFKTIDPSTIVTAYLTMTQGTEVVLEKDIEDATVGDAYIQWSLTQEETLALSPKMDAEYECRYKLNDGSAFVTKRSHESVQDVKKDGVI